MRSGPITQTVPAVCQPRRLNQVAWRSRYCLLSGELPFADRNQRKLMQRILSEDVRDPLPRNGQRERLR
jgi:hypothetical protein